MNEWQLFYKEKEGRGYRYVQVGGVLLNNKIPIDDQGIRASDILVASFNLYNGPNYVNFYCKAKHPMLENDVNGVFKLKFFVDMYGSLIEYGKEVLLKCENMYYDHSTDMLVFRLIPVSLYYAKQYTSIYIKKTASVKQVLVSAFDSVDGKITVVNSGMIKDLVKKADIKDFTYKGTVFDLVDRICKRYDLIYYYLDNKLFVSSGSILFKPTSKMNPLYSASWDMITRFKNVYNITVYHGIVLPGFSANFNGSGDYPIMSTMYFCNNKSGSVCTMMTYDFERNRGNISDLYREFASYTHSRFDKQIIDPPFILRGVDESDDYIESLVFVEPDYLGNNMYFTNDILNLHTLDKYKLTDMYPTDMKNDFVEASVRKLSPFAGYNVYDNSLGFYNEICGVSYPNVDVNLGIGLPVNGNLDESVNVGYLWDGKDRIWKSEPKDYRITFADGSTVYEHYKEGSITIVPRTRLNIAFYRDLQGDSKIYSVINDNVKIDGKNVKNRMSYTEKRFNLKIGNSTVEISEDKIEFKVGKTKLTISDNGIDIR